MQELLTLWKKRDRQVLISLIPFYHGFFARTKNPEALQIAADLGKATSRTYN